MSDLPDKFIEEESWLRQPWETNAAYHAFCLYRDYGGDRSIKKALSLIKSSAKHILSYCNNSLLQTCNGNPRLQKYGSIRLKPQLHLFTGPTVSSYER